MNRIKIKRIIRKWEIKGKPVPTPHVVKQNTIKHFQQKYNIKTFIETGTFKGDMLFALRKGFDELYSIELSEELYNQCLKRLSKYKNIYLYNGDSSKILPLLTKKFSNPSIFWLDAHYSGGKTVKGESETPVLQELDIILSSKFNHIILIDDARCFGNSKFPDYPSIEVLKKFVQKFNSNFQFCIEDDIIKIELL